MDEQNNSQTSIDNDGGISVNNNISSFPNEQSTSSDSSNIKNNIADAITKKDVVTRPLLWGLVVFLVFFALVIGAVSLYRMYNVDSVTQESSSINNSQSVTNGNDSIVTTPVTSDTNREANVIESEIQSIDTDLEADVYSDSSLGL